MNPDPGIWSGRSVFVTGHTGFKGGWLSLWLSRLGADVHGFALDPRAGPSMFGAARVAEAVASDRRGDIRDADAVASAIRAVGPSVVFHLAAQPLVLESFAHPLATFETNVMGTANVLEAARAIPEMEAVVAITTDKVYRNPETGHPFREAAPLGGDADPYSASKAASEMVAASWRRSFLAGSGIRVATARAGNVIGGGDWSPNRLVPDSLTAFSEGREVVLRHPGAVRPWQHVTEPLAGYLLLAEGLLKGRDDLARAWNYGPEPSDEATVGDVAVRLANVWGPQARVRFPNDPDIRQPHEAGLLRLDSTAIRAATGWRPRWPLDEALRRTVGWWRAWSAGKDAAARTCEDICAWEASE